MQEIKEQPTTASEATDGLAAAALRAEAWAGGPFLRGGEDAAVSLAPGTSRRRALDDALAEIEAGRREPSPGWEGQYGLILRAGAGRRPAEKPSTASCSGSSASSPSRGRTSPPAPSSAATRSTRWRGCSPS